MIYFRPIVFTQLVIIYIAQFFIIFKPKLIIMMDNFVKIFKTVLKRTMVVMVLLVAISASVSAQGFVSREIAIARLEAKATQVQQAISALPQNSLDYRFGTVQLHSYKAIYSEIVGNNASVSEAVDKLFATLSNNNDSVDGFHATIVEYNKKNKVSGFDVYQVIKNDVKQLLK
jgi:hypothetical protein